MPPLTKLLYELRRRTKKRAKFHESHLAVIRVETTLPLFEYGRDKPSGKFLCPMDYWRPVDVSP